MAKIEDLELGVVSRMFYEAELRACDRGFSAVESSKYGILVVENFFRAYKKAED